MPQRTSVSIDTNLAQRLRLAVAEARVYGVPNAPKNIVSFIQEKMSAALDELQAQIAATKARHGT